ncbi:MAG: RagB/SusD family nutrient uptake outer membrane protein, partial [Prevotella sp.]|nr:RagB/SusD family nutrient uptake outer membrane protein [Prevotella sp.]
LSPITSKKKDDSGDYWCTFENEMYPGNWEISQEENFQLNNIHDMVLIRFAEVLLMQSELKGDVSGINKLRARAGLADIPSYSLEALQRERRWELAFEGLRFNDIRRWHIAAAALEKQTNQECYYCGRPSTNFAHNGGYAARYNATAGFQKFPETEIILSEGALKQNEGWTASDCEYTDWNN